LQVFSWEFPDLLPEILELGTKNLELLEGAEYMAKKAFTVNGMSCQHCVAAVKKACEGVAGVKKAKVDLKKNSAEVDFDGEFPGQALKAAISEQGYEAVI
jgi:copper ion binding protein